jgi:hypothetical protein
MRVVASGGSFLNDGDLVRVVGAPASSTPAAVAGDTSARAASAAASAASAQR